MVFSKRRQSSLSKDDMAVIDALRVLKKELDYVHRNLDYATDPSMIDGYIYEMKSLQMKYKYFLGICKERGIVVEL